MSLSDPVMVALVNKLPPVGSEWPLDQRALWLSACEAALNLIYGPVERIDIVFVPAKQLDDRTADSLRRATSIETLKEPQEVGGAAKEEFPAAGGTDTAEPEERTSDEPADEQAPIVVPAAAPPLKKNVGGAPSQSGRPAGLPSNLAMAIEAITELGPAASTQIRNWIRKKHWAGLPDHWTSVLWNFAAEGKLAREGVNFALPKPKAPSVPARVPAPPVKPAPAPRPREIVTPGAKLGPPARDENAATFEWKGGSVRLHVREFRMLQRLKPVIGKGFLDFDLIASAAFAGERRIGSSQEWLRDMVPIINPKIASLGLELKLVEKLGYALREMN